jgi:hypothetical protein
MKKQAIWAAAILLAAIGDASAAKTTNVTFAGTCGGLDITVKQNFYVTALSTGCAEGWITIGVIARIGSVDYAMLSSNQGGMGNADMYVIQYPFVTGGTYTLYYTGNGKKGYENTGTYTLGAPAPSSANLPNLQPAR